MLPDPQSDESYSESESESESELTPSPVLPDPLLAARISTRRIMTKTPQLRRRQRYMGIMKLTHFQGFATQHSVLFLLGLLTEVTVIKGHKLFSTNSNIIISICPWNIHFNFKTTN